MQYPIDLTTQFRHSEMLKLRRLERRQRRTRVWRILFDVIVVALALGCFINRHPPTWMVYLLIGSAAGSAVARLQRNLKTESPF